MGDALPNCDLKEMKAAMGTLAQGTTLEDAPRANHILKGRTHKLELMVKTHANLRLIKKELEGGRPVIAVIKPRRGDIVGHSMVVRGVDSTRLRIVFDDPASLTGEREMEQIAFLREWGNAVILARVDSKPPQKELEDF